MKDTSRDARRRAMLAKIHIAKKQLGLDDGAYREMLRAVAGVDSAGKMGARQLDAVLAHMRRRGWSTPPKRGRRHGHRPHNIDAGRRGRAAQLKKIEALLTVGARPWSYADALAKRICKVDSIAFVEDARLYQIITALRKQAQREGWDLSGEM